MLRQAEDMHELHKWQIPQIGMTLRNAAAILSSIFSIMDPVLFSDLPQVPVETDSFNVLV